MRKRSEDSGRTWSGDPPTVDGSLRAKPLEVVYRRIEELKADPRNPRLHSSKQVRQIAESIRSFGFNSPVLVDAEGKIIAGHGRVLACQELGRTEVPTISLEHLTEAQATAYMLADNKLNTSSVWDEELLAEHLLELSELELDFSLTATGFEMGEIDFRIEGRTEGEVAANDPADEVPEPPSPTPVTRPGDLWLLGPHRLLCGDALDPQSYEVLMGSEQAAMIFTDTPYNVPIDGYATGLGAIRHRNFAMACGEMSEAEFICFLTQALRLLAQHSAEGSLAYLFIDWKHLGEMLTAGKQVYGELKNLCAWVKDNAGMGSLYRSQHELVLVFKKGGGPHINNVQLGRFGRNRSNVWQYPGANSFARERTEGNLLALHPTVKPVALVADALMDASDRGDLVLDAFLGSGTTLVAAERVGRVCRGIEIDPLYVDTAIRRWQALTGKAAVHASIGKTFESLAVEGGRADEQ